MPRFSELADWCFDADEVSPGRDRAGLNVEAFGLDPQALIQKCRQAAFEIMAERQKPDDSSLSQAAGGKCS